jgi:protoporphyrinogen oxidase
MKVAIIGAGLTGLSAANELKEFADVRVFERSEKGGLASSYFNKKRGYWIEKFYHHCFREDDVLLKKIKELKLTSKLVWKVAKIGFASDGKIFPLNTPFEILKYPHMSLIEKIKLAKFTLNAKKKKYINYDEIGVVDGIKKELGNDLFEDFFLPLLRSKFGDHYSEISYSWLLARVAIRSNRKYSGEELGYLRNGFQQLIEGMSYGIEIIHERPSIEKRGNGFIVDKNEFDAVIFTAPLPELDGSLASAAGLPDIKYQSSVCALLGADEGLTDDIYWTNLKDRALFGAIIEHTHFMSHNDYGEDVIYLASYSTPDGWLFNTPEKELEKLYIKDLERYGFKKECLNWIKIFKAKYSGPLYEKGYLRKITPYRTKLKGFYVAGLTSRPNYPERSMNGSIKAGIEVAEILKKDYGLF